MTTPTTSSSSSSQRKPSPIDLSLSTDQTVTGRTRSKSSSGGQASPTLPPTSPHKSKGLLSMLNLGAGRRTASSPNMTVPSSPVPSLTSSPVPTLSSSASSPSLSTMSGTTQKIKRKPVPPLPDSAQVNIAAAGNILTPLQTSPSPLSPSSFSSASSPRSPTRPLPAIPSITSPIFSSGQNLEVPRPLMPVKSISSSSKRSSIYSLKSTSSPNLGELSPHRHPSRKKADESDDDDEYEYIDTTGRVSSDLSADLSSHVRVNVGLNDIDWDTKENDPTLGGKKKGALRGFGTFFKRKPVDGEHAHHTTPTPPHSSNSSSPFTQSPERSSNAKTGSSRSLESSSSTNNGPLYINTADRHIVDTKPILSPPTGDEDKDLKRTLNDYATVYATIFVEKEIKRRSFRISQAFEKEQMDLLAASLIAGDGSALGQTEETIPKDKDIRHDEKKYEDDYIIKRNSLKRESFQSHLDYFGLPDFEFTAGEDPLKSLRERSPSSAKPPQRPTRSPNRPPSGSITIVEKRQEPNNSRGEPSQESGENDGKPPPPPRTSSLPPNGELLLHKRDSAPVISTDSSGTSSVTSMSPTSPTSPPRASVLSRSGSLSTASSRTPASKSNSLKGAPTGQVGSYAAIMESWEEEVSNSTAKNRRYLARKPVPSSLPAQSTRQRPPSSPPVTRDQMEEKDKYKESAAPAFPPQHASSPVRERPTSPPPPTRPLPDPFENPENEATAREYRPSFASFQSKTASSIYSSAYETASDRASVDGFYDVLSASSSAIDFTQAMPPEILVDGDVMRNDYVNQNRDQMYADDDEDGEEITEDEEEDDEDVFVDADGYSQEELERMKNNRRISKTIRKNSIRRADSRRAAADKLSGVGSVSAVTTSIVSARPLVPVLETILPETPETPEISLNTTDQNGEQSDSTVTMAQAPETEEEEVDFDEDAKLKAQLCWDEDPNFIEKERLSEWLGTNKPLNERALYYYMAKFDFAGLRLDRAFRKLCAKLYFKAETQQIDRILRTFAQQYWDNNPTSLFGSADVIHSIVYSLLLLNTDLHVAQGQGGHTKMTRAAFIKNTMTVILNSTSLPSDAYDETEGKGKPSSIRSFGSGRSWKGFGGSKEKGGYRKWWEGEVEKAMKEMYTDIKNSQILQPLGSIPTPAKNSRPISSMLGLSPSATLSTGTGAKLSRSTSFLDKNRSRQKERSVDDLPSDYSRMATLPVTSGAGSSRPTTPTSERSNRRDSYSSTLSGVSNMSATNTHSSRSHNASIPRSSSSIYASAPPYYKEGLVVRKHLLERADQKAKRRDWMECFISVDRGELKMYKLDGGNDRSRRVSMLPRGGPSLVNLTESFAAANGGNLSVTSNPSLMASLGSGWLSNAQPLGDIPLSHTFANALPPPGYNKSRPHVFALQLPDGGVYLFQANSQEQVNEWVFTCNYWAARESKEPLSGGVSNMEYGWGFCLEPDESGHMRDPDSVMIFEWKPPLAPMVPSNLDEVSQLRILRKHTEDITKEADQLRDIRSKMVDMFTPRSINHQKVITNWENYSQYLLQEIIKYTNYCDAIEQSIALQDKISKDVDAHSDIGLTSVIEEEAAANSRRTSFESNGRGKRYSLDGGTGSRPSSTGTTDTMKRAPVKRS